MRAFHNKASGTMGRRSVRALTLLAFLAALAACPPPVNETLATVVGDKIAPTLTITGPKIGQTYTSNVTFTGTVTDDAVNPGDGKGSVKSIDYAVANNVLLKGKILINADGSAQQVASFGSGAITWTAASRTFTFTFSTVTPSPLHGLLSVTIDAADANGNVTTQVIQLSEGTGPLITLSSPTPTTLTYTAGSTTVTLTGTVANASDDPLSATNISSITWGVTGKSWGATLNLASMAGASLSVANTGFSVNQNFTYTAATRQFSTSFVVPFINDTQLLLTVTATDFNGHTTTNTTVLVADVSGPQLTLTSPTTGLFYSSTNFTAYVVSGSILSTQVPTVQAVTYEVSGTGFDSGSVPVYSSGSPSNFFDASGNFSFPLSAAAASLSGKHGLVQVTITIPNSKASTVAQFTIAEDSDPPAVTGVALSSNNGNSKYAKLGETVTLTFQASDTGSGMAGTPTVLIEGVSAPVTPQGGGLFSAQHLMQAGDASDANVTFSITAKDVIGNTGIVTQASAGVDPATTTVKFYANAPTLSAVTMASTTNPNPAWAKTLDTVQVSFTTSRDLGVAPAVTLAGRSPTPAPASLTAHSYTASTSMTGTDAEGAIPFSITITDAAGNVSTPVTAVTSGSSVVFDRTPPTGYSVSAGAPYVNIASVGILNFTVSLGAAETGGSYAFTVKDAGAAHTVGPLTVTKAGSWTTDAHSVNVSGLNDGQLTISVTVTDAAGNPGTAPATTTVIKDTQAPVIGAVTTPTPYVNAAALGLMSFTLTLGTAESDGSYAYTVTDAGAAHTVGPVTVTKTGSWNTDTVNSVNVGSLNDGDLTISVTVTDVAGNPSTQTHTTKKDTQAPTGFSVSTAGLYVQNSLGFTLSLGAAETGGSYAYTITDAGSAHTVGPVTVTKTGSWSGDTVSGVNVSGMNQGTLTISVAVTDAAGNTALAPATKTITRDTQAPTGFSVSTAASYVQNSLDFALTLGAAETDGSYAYTITDAGSAHTVGPVTVTKTGSWPGDTVSGVNVSSLNDGPLTISVTVTDAAGNVGTPAATATTTKDTQPPAFTLGASASYVQNSLGFTITLGAAETGGSYAYTITDAGSAHTVGPVTVTKTGSWSGDTVSGVNVSSLNQGLLTISVTVTDAAGNGTTHTASTTRDTQAPTGFSVSTAGLYVQNSLGFTLSLGAAETGGSYAYTITDAGSAHTVGPVTVTKTGSWSGDTVSGVNVSSLNQGLLTISVTVTDAAGNAGTPAATATTTRDTQAPTGFSVSSGTYVNKAAQTAMSFTLTLGAEETDGSYSYTISDAGAAHSVGPATVNKSGAWISDTQSVDVSGLNEGNLTITVTVTDAAGNPGTLTNAALTIKDTVPPSILSIFQTGTNTAPDVNFDTAVYGPSSGNLDPASLTFSNDTAPRKQTVTPTGTVAMSNADKTATYTVTWPAPVPLTGDSISVIVAANSIYDAAGNPMTAGAYGGVTGSAKLLSVAGGTALSASSGNRSSFLGRVGSFVAATFSGTQNRGASTQPRVAQPAAAERNTGNAAAALPDAALQALRTSVPTGSVNAPTNTSVNRAPAANGHAQSTETVNFSDPVGAPSLPSAAGGTMIAASSAAQAMPELPSAQAVVAQAQDQGSALPSGLAVGLGVLAICLVSAGAWIGFRFLRNRSGRA